MSWLQSTINLDFLFHTNADKKQMHVFMVNEMIYMFKDGAAKNKITIAVLKNSTSIKD